MSRTSSPTPPIPTRFSDGVKMQDVLDAELDSANVSGVVVDDTFSSAGFSLWQARPDIIVVVPCCWV